MSLSAMTVSRLKDLRRQVEAAIHAKVAERRGEIETELLRLSRLDGRGDAKVVRARAKGMVAVKVGTRPDEPLVAGPKASTPKQPKKTKKARKTRRAASNAPASVSILASADHIEPLPIELQSTLT
jgi:capsid protein